MYARVWHNYCCTFTSNQKYKVMIYKLCISKNRIQYLKQQLGDNIFVTDEVREDNLASVEVTINDDMDALSLFHAGVMVGMNGSV